MVLSSLKLHTKARIIPSPTVHIILSAFLGGSFNLFSLVFLLNV